MDNEQYVAHWRDTGLEDWEVAQELVANKRHRHGLFFAHLALEKLLKAHVQRKLREHPPRIHNLVRLAEVAELEMERQQLETLAEMNIHCLEGHYMDTDGSQMSPAETNEQMARAQEMLQWLNRQLSKT